jgi:pilus assembly protein CpaB
MKWDAFPRAPVIIAVRWEESIVSRITPGTVIVGIFAVLFGLVGAYGVRKFLQTEKPEPPPAAAPRMQIVPLASMDLEQGRTIVLGNVALLQLTPEQIQKRMKEGKLPPQYMNNPQQIIGRILKTPLKQGEAFKTEDLYAEGTGPTIAEKLEPGLRAVTIPVEGTGALGGFDGPGSYVDVVFRSSPDDKAGIPETTVTLLEGVQVLGMEEADKRAPPGAKLENRVTLAVTADQANALKIAEGRGIFALSLRNPDDVQIAASSVPQTLDRLLNLPVQNQHVTAIHRGGGLAQSVSFPGVTVTPPPAVTLPVAGVLQMRAAQQTTSVEKEVPSSDMTSEPAPAPRAESQPQPATDAPSASPRLGNPPAPAKSLGQARPATETKTGSSDDLATVTVQIPVSVLLGNKMVGSGFASVSGSPAVATPPAPPTPTAPLVTTTEADPAAAATPNSSRPRKLLSDIGRRYWDKVPSNRTGN